MDPRMGANAMAGGAATMPQQGMPPQAGATTVTSEGTTTTQIDEVLSTLKQVLPQVVDEKGYVNMDKLITLWPQFSKVPFQVVMQLIQQTPDLLEEIIAQYGLNGISLQGRIISADELASLGSGGGGQ